MESINVRGTGIDMESGICEYGIVEWNPYGIRNMELMWNGYGILSVVGAV
jgi:hypothetical protein